MFKLNTSLFVLFVWSLPALAVDFSLSAESPSGTTSISVKPNCKFRFRIVGQLSNSVNDGTAGWSTDVRFTTAAGFDPVAGAVLFPATASFGASPSYFVMPRGITNPQGYGGVVGPGGSDDPSTLQQIGGGQNTIRNTDGTFPIGGVLANVGHTAQVLATGTAMAPSATGSYKLRLRNVAANVILDNELANPSAYFYRTEPATLGTLRDLDVTVTSSARVPIIAANPPMALDNPYVPGAPFRDTLQTGTSTTQITEGIGASGTANQGDIQYATINVTFGCPPSAAPLDTSEVFVSCTNNFASPPLPATDAPCPTVSGVSGSGAGPYTITLSNAIPTRECTTITFAGSDLSGQRLQYQSLPADVNLDGTSNTQDELALIQAVSNGDANLTVNSVRIGYARYNLDRSTGAADQVNTQDLLRMIQLLNGTNTTEAWNGKTVAVCP